MIVYWVDRSAGMAFTARAAWMTAALLRLGVWPDRFYADAHDQITERRQGLKAAVAEMLDRREPDVLAIPADQFSRLPEEDQGWIIRMMTKRGHRVHMLGSATETSADSADGSETATTNGGSSEPMLLLDDDAAETAVVEVDTAGPMMDGDGGREGDGTEDSGGKHGGGGSDTNDNKDDGHIPPGDKK